MFYRKIEEKLDKYYKNKDSKILVIDGARQIGKSFIVRETAKKYFKNYIEINLKSDYDGNRIFESVKTIDSFYLNVSALYGDKLSNIDETIIFLDEIQCYPNLLSLLKDLKLDNRYRYIASGSLLGITLKHIFIPMGSIEEVKMYPMDFEEFLLANNIGKDVIAYLKDCFINLKEVDSGVHKTIINKFKEYLICGGLPDSVREFVINKNVFQARKNQELTYSYYKDDAAQYDIEHNLKIRTIYDYLPSYMENKVKRLQYKKIENKRNSNYQTYEDEFDYLINSGCALGVKAVSNPKFPLVDSVAKNLIKLYYNDVGILSYLLFGDNINTILQEDTGTNLGSLYETACATELAAHGKKLFYYDNKKKGEVDFLLNDYEQANIYAIEVKSGKDQNNYRAIPKLVKDPYNISKGFILANKNLVEENDNLITLPIYMIMFI